MVILARRVVLRWIFLVVLALGIVGMHHLAVMGPDMDPLSQVTPVSAVSMSSMQAEVSCCDADSSMKHHPAGTNDMLHLCLAVLGASVVLMLSWLLLCSVNVLRQRQAARPPWAAGIGRGPPAAHAAPALLLSLGVLRL